MYWKAGAAKVTCLLALLCQICEAQPTRLEDINGTRLVDSRYNNREIYGRLELQRIDGSWIRALSPHHYGYIESQTGNVLCRSLGYGRYLNSDYGSHTYTNAANLAAVNCLGNESSIAQCFLPPHASLYAYGNGDLWLRCNESRCHEQNGGCGQICYNNPVNSSEICGCRHGYSPAPGNLTACIDVDECLKENGGCSHGCVNTIGSRTCTCPTYMKWDVLMEQCTATAFNIHCESDRMTASFLKDAYPMLSPEKVTLLGGECTPTANKTHMIFSTRYDSCMTEQSEDSGGIKYRNAVISQGSHIKNSGIQFATTVNIPFTCIIGRRSWSSASVKTVPITFTTAPASIGSTSLSIRLCYDANCTSIMSDDTTVEGYVLYAELSLSSQDVDLKFSVENCSVRPQDSTEIESVDLITNGLPAADWVKIIDSSGQSKYQFQYPAFTFTGYDGYVSLECRARLVTSRSLATEKLRTVGQESDQASRLPSDGLRSALNSSSPTKIRADVKTTLISSCAEASSEGTYLLIVGTQLITVWCDTTSDDGPWLTVMRRNNNRLNFNRTWHEYETGFGSLGSEFWLGNEKLHTITTNQEVTMKITLTTFHNVSKYAQYSGVTVGSASEGYSLSMGEYTGNAGDMRNTSGCSGSREIKNPVKFSTYDKDNDGLADYNCAGRGGGWWYHDCVCTCLTCGPSTNRQILTRVGMIYHQLNDFYVLKDAEMSFRIGPPKAGYPNSLAVKGSDVACDSKHAVVSLKKEVFEGPTPEPFIVHSDSLLQQTSNNSHILLKFRLRGMDTLRQEDSDKISYVKSVEATTTSVRRYYRRIVIKSTCVFNKSVTLQTAYRVREDDVNFGATENGNYQTKIVMSKDEQFTKLLDNLSEIPEGETVYVKVLPASVSKNLRLALRYCYLGGASTNLKGHQIINESCPVDKDVQILMQDTFMMRIPSYLHDEQGTRVFCDVQFCTTEDSSCDTACGKGARKK